MITLYKGILDDQYQQGETVERLEENEWLDQVQKFKLGAEKLSKGLVTPAQGRVVNVELQGDETYVTRIFEIFPSFSEWGCLQCKGMDDHCVRCSGEGWDIDRESNGFGVFVSKVQIGPKNHMYMLLRTFYFREERDT